MGWAIFLHFLAVVIWVGGMFFAHQMLRPVAASLLEPPQRLQLWAGVFKRFFPLVWASVLLTLSSGLYMILFVGGFKAVPLNIHVMFGIGLAMACVFFFVYFVPYGKLVHSVNAQEWKQGGKALASIRKLIGFNLSLGLLNIFVAVLGRL